VDYTRWQELLPPIVDSVLAACRVHKTPLIFCDNLYMYGPEQVGQGPLRPDMPYTTSRGGRSSKPLLRARLAQKMLDHHAAGHSPVVLCRSSDFFGPGVTLSMVGEGVVEPLLAGRAATLLPSADELHAFTYAPDAARAMITLADDCPAAFGKAWHVPNNPPLTQRAVVEKLAAAAGAKAKVSVLPGALLCCLGATCMPLLGELHELQYQRENPFLVDDSEFLARFPGSGPTPMDEAVAATVVWYQARAEAKRAASNAGASGTSGPCVVS